KNNHITDAEAGLTMAMRYMDDGKLTSRFYTLKLEIQKVASLALSWTLVHVIDEESPFYEMSKEEMQQTDFELMYYIKGFDDNFSNIVQQRTSYTSDEMIYGARFLPAFHRSADGMSTVLDLDKLNYHEQATVPEPERSVINQ